MTKLKLVVDNPLHEQVLWIDSMRYTELLNHIEPYHSINELGENLMSVIINTIAVCDKQSLILLNEVSDRPIRYDVKPLPNPDTPLSPEVAAMVHKAKFGIDALYDYVDEGNMDLPKWADTFNDTIYLWIDYLEQNAPISQPDPYLPMAG